VRAAPNARPPTSADSLKAHLEGRTDLAESVVEVAGKRYHLVRPSVADALIDEREFEHDERLPYWAELWPSAIALARRLSREDLAGKAAIELGCGVGLPTVCALDRGARVLATDHYEAALDFAAHNARRNGLPEPETALLDWHAPRIGGRASFDLVLAADVLYEERGARALAGLVPGLLKPGGEALLADPGRRWEPLFRELMRGADFRFETEETTVRVEGVERGVKVVLHRVRGG
jgi:predicted nicotinamide N-methyase